MTSPPDLVQVAEVREIYLAEMMALRLRAAGIDAQVLDQSFRQEPLPSVRAFAVVRVLVPADQLEAARRALADSQPLSEDWEPSESQASSAESPGPSRAEERKQEPEEEP